MPTGQTIITGALNLLGTLQAGGTPSTSETAMGLSYLNQILEEWQAQSFLGNTETVSVSGRQITRSVSNAGVWTTTDTGGTETRVVTPTAVSTFASANTNNTYPVGWQPALEAALAVKMAGAMGMPQEVPRLAAMAEQAISQIRPKDVTPEAAQ